MSQSAHKSDKVIWLQYFYLKITFLKNKLLTKCQQLMQELAQIMQQMMDLFPSSLCN
jgi:hypothetical protein